MISLHLITHSHDPGRPSEEGIHAARGSLAKAPCLGVQAECHVKKECVNLETGAVLDLFAKS